MTRQNFIILSIVHCMLSPCTLLMTHKEETDTSSPHTVLPQHFVGQLSNEGNTATKRPKNMLYSIVYNDNTHVKPELNSLQNRILLPNSMAVRPRHQTVLPTLNPEQSKRRPDQWIKYIHRCAPSTDWRACEAESIRHLMVSHRSDSITEEWKERGPSDTQGNIRTEQVAIAHLPAGVYLIRLNC